MPEAPDRTDAPEQLPEPRRSRRDALQAPRRPPHEAMAMARYTPRTERARLILSVTSGDVRRSPAGAVRVIDVRPEENVADVELLNAVLLERGVTQVRADVLAGWQVLQKPGR